MRKKCGGTTSEEDLKNINKYYGMLPKPPSSSKSIDMINQQKPKEKMQEKELKTYNKEWAVLEKSIFRAETSVELIKGFNILNKSLSFAWSALNNAFL